MYYKQYISFTPLYAHMVDYIQVYTGCPCDNTLYDYHGVVTIYNIGQIREILRKDSNIHFYNTDTGISWYLPTSNHPRIYLNKRQFTKTMIYPDFFQLGG